jgi:hypothetical protein
MINTHPQRWEDRPLPWIKELTTLSHTTVIHRCFDCLLHALMFMTLAPNGPDHGGGKGRIAGVSRAEFIDELYRPVVLMLYASNEQIAGMLVKNDPLSLFFLLFSGRIARIWNEKLSYLHKILI